MLQLLSFAAPGISSPAARPCVYCASSVLVERFPPSRFNKLPYVSICSTTGESELTFQSAGPHRPRISTSTPFITLNERADRVKAVRHHPRNTPPRAAFSTFIHFFSTPPAPRPGKLKPVELCSLSLSSWKSRDLPFSISTETTDKALLPGGQQTCLLGVFNMS